ncbi:LmbU family transcriptional regulator [Amycolatopsis umgeniensis]|uniref:LmbU n=1 Tax=Amycolatopsis umgeniensis TaxID=336628 RepID=A0A841B3T4_9PSEU|nr:LmbU family transcriptional regulator [Amycolatopsis umgeniensis]MBB5855699.1 hypothetical protein [Amycolatopsis umgeniensis]
MTQRDENETPVETPARRDREVLISPTGLMLPRDLSYDSWAQTGVKVARIANSSAWCLGDWLVCGQQRYPDRYQQAVALVGLEYQTLRNYAWVARRVGAAVRRAAVSFQHHSEVASLPAEAQDQWLRRAEQGKWSRNQLRAHLRQSNQDGTAQQVKPDAPRQLPKIHVRGERLAWWQAAAEQHDGDFQNWVVAALDKAAGQVLTGPAVVGPREPVAG